VIGDEITDEAHDYLMYADVQDSDWARAAEEYGLGTLEVPKGTVIKVAVDSEIITVSFALSKNQKRWSSQVMEVSKRITGNGEVVAGAIVLGMGCVLNTKDPEEGSVALFSMANGVRPSELPGSSEHLISHMILRDENGFDRVVAAPVLEDGSLGAVVDTGYSNTVVTA
jgi:hypothetical protein